MKFAKFKQFNSEPSPPKRRSAEAKKLKQVLERSAKTELSEKSKRADF